MRPKKDRDENSKNYIKTNIVNIFDNSMKKLNLPEKLDSQDMMDKMFKDVQKLLEKTLKEFEEFNQNLYA